MEGDCSKAEISEHESDSLGVCTGTAEHHEGIASQFIQYKSQVHILSWEAIKSYFIIQHSIDEQNYFGRHIDFTTPEFVLVLLYSRTLINLTMWVTYIWNLQLHKFLSFITQKNID